jgi:pullulanase
MQKRLGIVVFSSLAVSALMLSACQQGSQSLSSSSGNNESSQSSSQAPVDPTWEDYGVTYQFPTPVGFTGADNLPAVDHVVVFVPISTGYKNVYLWNAVGGSLPAGSSNWPGVALSTKYDDNWWKVDLTGITSTNIIFNVPSPQTADMTITHSGYWWFWTSDDNVHDSVPVSEWVDAAVFTDGSNMLAIANVQIQSFKLYEGSNVLLTGSPSGQAITIHLNKHEIDLVSGYRIECMLKGAKTAFTKKIDIYEVFNSDAFNSKYAYSGSDLGLTYTAASSSFKVWSPLSTALILRVYDNGTPVSVSASKGSDAHTDYPMSKGEKGVWSAKVDGDLNGKYYTYIVTNSSYTSQEVVDPYAKAVGINGLRGEILDLSTTNPEGWNSVAVNNYDRKSLAIWECHIADLTSSATWTGTEANRKKYAGFHEAGTTYTANSTTVSTGFDHVKELGVNAVQILPFFDQANDETLDVNDPANNKTNGAFNWGYNPLNYNAPEGIYSSNPYDGATRIKELKALIADYAKSGINIIMDVVYNHVAGANQSNFDVLMPGYYFRYSGTGALSNGSGCGNETASEHYMMRKFMLESTTYWAKEYKLGGFRFDLMGLHDIETMNQIAAACKAITPNFFIHGEPWEGGTTELEVDLRAEQANVGKFVGYGQFNDGMRDSLIKGGLNSSDTKGWVTDMDYAHDGDLKNIVEGLKGTTDSSGKTLDPNKTTNYVTCHDNYTLTDRIIAAIGRFGAGWTYQMCTLANSVVFTSQGTSFMLSGEEFFRTKGRNSNSYNASYDVNTLDYALKIKNNAAFQHYKKLIALKKTVDGLHLGQDDAQKLDIQTSGANEIVFTLKDTANGKTYKVVHANGYSTPAAVDFSGYSNVYLDTLDSGVALSSSTAIKNYQTLIAVK